MCSDKSDNTKIELLKAINENKKVYKKNRKTYTLFVIVTVIFVLITTMQFCYNIYSDYIENIQITEINKSDINYIVMDGINSKISIAYKAGNTIKVYNTLDLPDDPLYINNIRDIESVKIKNDSELYLKIKYFPLTIYRIKLYNILSEKDFNEKYGIEEIEKSDKRTND